MERQTHSGTPWLRFAASYKCRFHLGFTACLKRPQMDLPETGVAANSLAMGVKGIGQVEQSVCSRVGDYGMSTIYPPRYGVIRSPGTPDAPQSPQVEGGGQQCPFGSDVAQTTQQEPSQPLLLLDDSEDGFHQLLSLLERRSGLVCGHPGAMTAQSSVIGAYCQAPAGRTTGDARSGDWTRLANVLEGLVHSLVRFPRGCRQKSERVLNCCKLGRVWRVGVWWQRTVATI